MSSLQQLKSEEYMIMQKLIDLGGDVTDNDYETRLLELQNEINRKTGAFISVASKEGLLDREISRTKQMIEDCKDYIEQVEGKREWIERVINVLAVNSDMGYLEYVFEGVKKFVKPFFKQRSEIDLTKVEAELRTYTIPRLSFEEIRLIEDSIPKGATVAQKLKEAKETCNVTDLPEKHPALSVRLIPSFKVIKNRPKPENIN